MPGFEPNLVYRRPAYSLPPAPDLTKFRPEDLFARPTKYSVNPPENSLADRVVFAFFACFLGYGATLFTAMILTRTSFESKTKTAISLAGGATVAILTYTNPLISVVAFAILATIACAISKDPSSTDGFLQSIGHNDQRNFPHIDHVLMQRDWDAVLQRQEQMYQQLLPIRPLVYPMVIHPLDRMPPFFFYHVPAVPGLQPDAIRAKGG